MIKFAIKSLLAVLLTSSTLLLTSTISSAQVNMKVLAQVAKSCQEDALSPEYYLKMGIEPNIPLDYLEYKLRRCIHNRYHYLLVLSKFPWISTAAEILPGYPSSVAVATIANSSSNNILECIISQNPSSQECNSSAFSTIALEHSLAIADTSNTSMDDLSYPIYVCPSCVTVHNDLVRGSSSHENNQKIVDAFIQWFMTLEKPKRRELMSVLGSGNEQYAERRNMLNEADVAVNVYLETRTKVEQQQQEQRRQELLGK